MVHLPPNGQMDKQRTFFRCYVGLSTDRRCPLNLITIVSESAKIRVDCTVPLLYPWPPFSPRINGAHRSGSRGDSESGDYLLLIHDETGSRDFSLRFPGGKRIREVKGDIHDLTSIPVRHQHWTGWPPNIDQENVRLFLSVSSFFTLNMGLIYRSMVRSLVVHITNLYFAAFSFDEQIS